MNTNSKSSLVRCLLIAAPLLLVAASQAEAAAPCATAPKLDARLAGLADRGVAPFVQFVHRTQLIYQVDVNEALARVATYRHNVAACKAAADE